MSKHGLRDEMRRCIHFTGLQNEACAAGINYRQHVGGPDFGWAKKIPCLDGWFGNRQSPCVPCAKRETPTMEQAQAELDRLDAMVKEAVRRYEAGLPMAPGVTAFFCLEEDMIP